MIAQFECARGTSWCHRRGRIDGESSRGESSRGRIVQYPFGGTAGTVGGCRRRTALLGAGSDVQPGGEQHRCNDDLVHMYMCIHIHTVHTSRVWYPLARVYEFPSLSLWTQTQCFIHKQLQENDTIYQYKQSTAQHISNWDNPNVNVHTYMSA